MAHIITRRDALAARRVGGAAALRLGRRGRGPDPARRRRAAPKPADREGRHAAHAAARRASSSRTRTIFRANTAKFTQATGVEIRVDFVGWEDIRQQTAVAANTGAGPDIIIGWAEDPHIYADKLIELSDVAEYLGKRYGGWTFLGREVRQEGQHQQLDRPSPSAAAPARSAIASRPSRRPASTSIPNDHAAFLKLCQELKKTNKPAGFALGNAVGDGNGFANWLLWSHGGYLVDEDGKVAINSKETIEALKYLKELYPTFVPGTLAWGDPSNNRAYAANECWLTANGVSLYFALKNDPATRGDRRGHRACAAAVRRGRQAAAGLADPQRHGVQAHASTRTPPRPTSTS